MCCEEYTFVAVVVAVGFAIVAFRGAITIVVGIILCLTKGG